MMPTKRGVKHYVLVESFHSGVGSSNGLGVQVVRVHTLSLRKSVGVLNGVIRTTGHELNNKQANRHLCDNPE